MAGERNTWTDARIDAFRKSVDSRFDETNQRMDAGFARVDGELRALNHRFDSLQRVLIQVGATMIAALLTMIVTMAGLLIAQL